MLWTSPPPPGANLELLPQGLRVEDALNLCRVLYLKTDRLSPGEGVIMDLVALALQKPADLGLCPLDLWLCTPRVPNSGLRNLALVPAQPLGVCPHCASQPCLLFSLNPNLPSHPVLFGVTLKSRVTTDLGSQTPKKFKAKARVSSLMEDTCWRIGPLGAMFIILCFQMSSGKLCIPSARSNHSSSRGSFRDGYN